MSRNETPPDDELNTTPTADTSEPIDSPAEAGEDQASEAEETAPAAEMAEEEQSLTVQLEQAEARAQDYLDSLQRERAAFQNYKKRVERERTEQAQSVTASVLVKLLPVLDDFGRAMEAVPIEGRDEWFEGITLIQRKFERFLEEQGVAEIEALGQPFDPNLHEAVGVDSDSGEEHGIITQVLLRGYQRGGQVLRPAMVWVAG